MSETFSRRDARLVRIAASAMAFQALVRGCRHPRLSRQLDIIHAVPRSGARRALSSIRKNQELMMSAAGIGNRAQRRHSARRITFALA